MSNNQSKNSSGKIYFILGLLVLLLVNIGVLITTLKIKKTLAQTVSVEPNFKQIRENNFSSSTFKFINPLLTCEASEDASLQDFHSLREKLTIEIEKRKQTHEVDSVSIYFDNRNGRWLGINLLEEYFPASMMKVPLMMALFKKAQEDPTFLSKKVVFKKADIIEQNFSPEQTLIPENTYTIEELIERLIVYSDNNTLPLLNEALGKKDFKEVNEDLGITLPQNGEMPQDYIPTKEYANFFRVLYNASYLNKKLSEKALTLLSKTTFTQGLVAGVPSSTIVAHKFGERNLVDSSGQSVSRELHDCGIVYYAEHPYLLCIMTKGKDFNKLAETIKTLSALTYNEVEKMYEE